jgi:hypothetical protein
MHTFKLAPREQQTYLFVRRERPECTDTRMLTLVGVPALDALDDGDESPEEEGTEPVVDERFTLKLDASSVCAIEARPAPRGERAACIVYSTAGAFWLSCDDAHLAHEISDVLEELKGLDDAPPAMRPGGVGGIFG